MSTPEEEPERISALTPPNNNLSEDELLVKTFADLIQKNADDGELKRIQSDPSDLKAIQKALTPGLYWGGLASLVTFAALRRLPKWMMNKSLQKRQSFAYGKGGNPHYDLARKTTNPLMPRLKIRKDGNTSFREGWILGPFFMGLDGLMSLGMGGVVWFGCTPKEELYQAAADIPLREGKSPVSDVLCQDFIDNYQRLPKKLWKDHRDDVVVSLKQFIDNCQRRKQYERQIRRDYYMNDTEEVSIPPPGVPKDAMIEDAEDFSRLPATRTVGGAGERDSFWVDPDWEEEEDEWDDG